jgi:hypothetical protein
MRKFVMSVVASALLASGALVAVGAVSAPVSHAPGVALSPQPLPPRRGLGA